MVLRMHVLPCAHCIAVRFVDTIRLGSELGGLQIFLR